MFRRLSVLFYLCLLFLIAGGGSAYPQQGRSFGPIGLMRLVSMKPVQEELGIEDDSIAIAEIRTLRDSMVQEMKESYQNTKKNGTLPKVDPFSKLSAKYDEKLVPHLKAEQLARLKQISWQDEGPRVLLNTEVQENLKLSEEQKNKLMAVHQQFEEKQRERYKEMRAKTLTGDKIKETFDKVVAEWNEQSSQVLSDDQRKQLEQLLGKPFSLSSSTEKP